MKKYYFNDGTAQQGPFTLEELQAKNITADTPVWYDGLPDWTTAGQVEELKDILVHTPPAFHVAAVEEVKPVTSVVEIPVATTATITETPSITATVKTTPAAAKSAAKKSTAWLSYVLGLLVLGGVGYYVYQDMGKNKVTGSNATQPLVKTDSSGHTATQQPSTNQPASTSDIVNSDTTKTGATTTTTTTEAATTTPATTTTTTNTSTTTQPSTVTTAKITDQPATSKPTVASTTKAQQDEARKMAQKKAMDEKKKQQIALAAAAKEKEYRNNWAKYISFGNIDYTKDNRIDGFDVPVYNGTNAMLEKVTVRVDYMKKEKKVFKSETIVIYNIPPGAGLNGKATGSRKGDNVKVFITGITSRKLHFCYPANNGNPDDPYFCN